LALSEKRSDTSVIIELNCHTRDGRRNIFWHLTSISWNATRMVSEFGSELTANKDINEQYVEL